ncbi:DNA replication/repair protein RecF [Legionella sp. km772]|uniref:DNA replication/repair protein RecF n=1 Tax=Legionella sp. km772 TaxID=2498111 RepID=UPI000F8D19F8|nr:DNA replication/repair protein RecF [Legionella sp. km772]RUR12629.1 DNA replication/repair protein RecF [Legionella sp. km772]
MILTDLKIHHLRAVDTAHLRLNPRFNFIIGPNGSGKTSILEALYLLSCGHSFRSREIVPIIAHEQDKLTVFAQGLDNKTVSIQKSKSLPTQIKLNNQFCSTTSQLAYALPCQIINSDIFQIIDATSSIRRSLLDWGLFHVKPNYLALWKEYRRVLKQRNALLKQSNSYDQFIPWDKQLSYLAEQLDNLRSAYFELWNKEFSQVLSSLTTTPCSIQYYKGWDKKQSGKSLATLLAEHFHSDKQRQYTQFGAHHADLIIDSNAMKAKQALSRGQQKIILIALKLAQGRLLKDNCLYLFDDLAAELDEPHQSRLINYLISHPGQYVVTATHYLPIEHSIAANEKQLFAIDRGVVDANVSRETFALC